tara:strand:+ start:926 stop:1345 length:420 start_codon:yes stop_codon:yes gene_type:complete
MNIKYIVSYLGLIPFLFLTIDGYFLGLLDTNFIQNIAIILTCIIFTFIGAYNWDFQKNNNLLELYGFLPSLLSMLILFFNTIGFNQNHLVIILIILLSTQLLIDFIMSLKNFFPMRYYLNLRLPITLSLCFFLYFISIL